MTDNSSIDLSLANLWNSWRNFRRGKKPSRAIRVFESELERNLLRLCANLNGGNYRHGSYDHKIVNEKKRRDIAVAGVCDRVVHRLLYDYLVPMVDRRLDFDVWSCRPGKGLHGGLRRTHQLAVRYAGGWFWRADITKFFDNVDHAKLKACLRRLIADESALALLDQVIDSYRLHSGGIPIGNLTSQIFANIYLHEFDRFVRHHIQPLGYVRYGDDFVMFFSHRSEASEARTTAAAWLGSELKLRLHSQNDIIEKVCRSLHFLGHVIWPAGQPLVDRAMSARLTRTLNARNAGSYRAMHLSAKQTEQLPWLLMLINQE